MSYVHLHTAALKEYKKVYENILSMEKRLDSARKHLVKMCVCGIAMSRFIQ